MYYPTNITFGRSRTEHSVNSTMQALHKWWFNGTPSADYLTTFKNEQEWRVMGDTVEPEFKKAVASGKIVLHNMVYRKSKASYRPLTFDWTGTSGATTLRVVSWAQVAPGGAEPFMEPVPLWNSLSDAMGEVGLRDAAIVKAWSKVDQSAMNALATLGELPETLSWLKSILQRAVNVIRALRGKGLKLPSKVKRLPVKGVDLPGLWLEWRYALRPLLFEYKQVLEALARIIEKNTRQTARAFTFDTNPVVQNYDTLPGYGIQYGWRLTNARSIQFRGGVLYDLSDALNELTTIWGLDQPLEAIWELVPFSFILDWFFNIGNILSAWSTGIGLSPLGSWVSMTCIETRTGALTSTPSYSASGYTTTAFNVTQNPYYRLERTTKHRWINPSTFVLPSVKIRLDLAKILDLCAIGRQLLLAKR